MPAVTGGVFVLSVSGDAGPDYTVQASTNFIDWTLLLSTNSPALPLACPDPHASDYPQRFYRVLLGP